MQLEQIQKCIAAIDPIKYAKTRNFLNGEVSRLSPYISRGVISTKQVMHSVLKNGYQPFKHEKWIQQLAWREYFQRVLQHKKNLATVAIKNEQNTNQSGFPEAVYKASTGINAIDKSIQELYETGYMHNHCRMYVSSIVTNIARTDWQVGAKWMYYHLFDADVASNGCSWQWVCGSFSSKKYLANQENINKYSNSFQKDTFLDLSYDELPYMSIPEPLKETIPLLLKTKLPDSELLDINPDYPTLIYTFYNLDPKWHSNEKANRILLLEPSHFEAYPISGKSIDFLLTLKNNIDGIKIFTGEYAELKKMIKGKIICKEHPLFNFSDAMVERRDWIFPEVNDYYPSFFSFWKKAERLIKI